MRLFQPQHAVASPTHGWRIKIKTIAPDGPAADAYTRNELVAIKTTLGC